MFTHSSEVSPRDKHMHKHACSQFLQACYLHLSQRNGAGSLGIIGDQNENLMFMVIYNCNMVYKR